MTGVTSSSLTSLSFVVIKRLVGGLDCLADLFPLTCDGPFRHSDKCDGPFRHSDELELLEGLDVSFQRNPNYRQACFINKRALMIISRARGHMANRCQLVHLALTLKWLLYLPVVLSGINYPVAVWYFISILRYN